MSVTTTRTARSVIYLGCIGGLLVLNSFAISAAWNALVVRDEKSNSNISVLEGAGITAFVYVIVMSIRHGSRRDLVMFDAIHRQSFASARSASMKEQCAKLSPEQKAALKHELITKCGCTDEGLSLPHEQTELAELDRITANRT